MSWVQWFDAAAATVSTSVKSAVDSAAVAVQNATSKIEEATRPVAAGAVASGEPEAKGEENKESAGEPMSGSGAPVDKEEQTSEKGLLQATSERWSSLVEKVWTSSETAGVASRPPPPDVGPGEPDKGVLLSLFDTVAKKIEATLKPEGSGDLLTAASGGAEGGAPLLPPWHVEGPQAEKMPVLKAQILNLSQEKWNFMQSPPEDILDGFHFSMSEMSPMAVECLKLDPQLEKMRWLLVPWKVKEEVSIAAFASIAIRKDRI